MNLTGKKIIVTGGASGIGQGAVQAFQAAGASVFIVDLAGPALEQAKTLTNISGAVACDVTVEAQCDEMVNTAVSVMGGIDGLFHCAGVADQLNKVMDIDIDVWQRIVDVNVRGTFLTCRAVGRVMMGQGYGSIVNISSVQALSGQPRRHAYGPAKAAVALLTKTLACEWGSSDIRVNALVPGYINTPMIQRLKDEKKIDIPKLEGRTPLKRFGRVQEVASAAGFLLSDEASYITGAILPVDGGWCAYGGAGNVEDC